VVLFPTSKGATLSIHLEIRETIEVGEVTMLINSSKITPKISLAHRVKCLACLISLVCASVSLAESVPHVRSMRGQALFIAWGPLNVNEVSLWKRNGFTCVYKLIGDFDWSKVEPAPGVFDFSNWNHDRQILESNGLYAFPSLEFLTPPHWFLKEHPNALMRYGGSSEEKIGDTLSLAWLGDQAKRRTPAWSEFRGYTLACLKAMRSDPSVIGVEFPWTAFNGRLYQGSWDMITNAPSQALLGDFNPAALRYWRASPTPPGNVAELEALPMALQRKWEEWIQSRLGVAFVAVSRLIHLKSPSYWIAVDKHIWVRDTQTAMKPILATTAGCTANAFNTFLKYVDSFSKETGDRNIIFDDDALFDTSKIENFQLTRDILRKHGFLFMGESENGPEGVDNLLKSVEATHPDAIIFLPAPGGYGKWVTTSVSASKIISLVKNQIWR